MLRKIIISYFLLSILITLIFTLKCDEEEIDNCIECGIGENSGTCSKCKDMHFLFFNNLLCLPCDDPLYGQIRCGGNCDGTNYQETSFALCDNSDCKEGFFNLNGICYKCDDDSPGCSKCEFINKGKVMNIFVKNV